MVALWVPKAMLDAIDKAVQVEDSDRSKFIRQAIRQRVCSLMPAEPSTQQESN